MTQRSPKSTPTTAPIPANEAERLAALRRYKILDTPPEVAFDRLTALAARLFNVPIALVSLLDESRAWFKSGYGFEPREVGRNDTICSFAVLSDEILVALDTRQDPRFICNPFVQSDPGVRCYIGAPLITQDGFNLGTLCLLDTQPREAFSVEQQASLNDLAAMVVDELELRLAVQRIAQTDAAMLEVTQGVSGVTGEAFFDALVQHFAKVLGVDYAYIGLLVDPDQESLRTIATCAHHQIVENFEYLLRDTPCKEVIQQRKLCCHPQNVQMLFPDAPLLAPLQVESYVAVPFYDSTGTPLGLLGVMDGKPLENVHLAEFLLPTFALRIVAELERQWASEQQARTLIREQAARQQAETANRIKDEFLAVLSHELRSPLNPILGWAKLLQQGKLDATKTKAALEIIGRNAQLQAQLINDLLDISRILRGKLSLEQAPVDLSLVITSALETVRLAAEAKGIDLRFAICDFGLEGSEQSLEFDATNQQLNNPKSKIQNPKLQVLGDAGRLQQVVWNLLSNAVKFTPPGGQVTVRLEQVEMTNDEWRMANEDTSHVEIANDEWRMTNEDTSHVEIANDEWRMTNEDTSHFALHVAHFMSRTSHFAQITVTDTGKGICSDFLPSVFEHFRQEDGATTRKFGGLGLGLAIARQIVEMHGGQIGVDSAGEWQGATFTVRLPLLKSQGDGEMGRWGDGETLSTLHSELRTPLAGVRVLVVDDDTDCREFVGFVLEQAGAIVTTVASGTEALQAFSQAVPDMIISDIGMPEMDGYMMLRQIRALPQGKQVPAIALTAYAGELDQQQAIAAGFQRHIAKPTDPGAVVAIVAELLFQPKSGNPKIT